MPISCKLAEMNDKIWLRTLPFRLCSNPKPYIRFHLVGFTNPVRSLRDSSIHFNNRSSTAFFQSFPPNKRLPEAVSVERSIFSPINDVDGLIKNKKLKITYNMYSPYFTRLMSYMWLLSSIHWKWDM